jgi:uncharacterized protein (DUF4415 family)
MDPEMKQFEEDLLESVRQARRGETARVHTPEQIASRRGRPKGSTSVHSKQAVKLRLDPDLLQALRASGAGWQTRVNAILRDAILNHK